MTTSIASRKFAHAKCEVLANFHRAALRTHMLAAPQVQAVLKMFPANVRKDVYVSALNYSDAVYFQLTMRDLDSLKDKKLLRVLESFASEGWDASSSDYTYNVPNRDYRFTRKVNIERPNNPHSRWLVKQGHLPSFEGDYFNMAYNVRERLGYELPTMPVEIQVIINAYVKEDSASCRIEVVERKERVVVDEVKRIVCA